MPVSEVVRLLKKAKRPLIHIGNGARHAEKEFFQLIERHKLPFVTARNANDITDHRYTFYIGRPGTFAQRGANFAVQLADLYVAIGTSLSLTQTGYNTKDYARNAQIVQVDIDQAILDKGTLRNPIKIRQDAKEFLTELLNGLETPDWSAWVKRCESLRDRYPVCLPEYKDQQGSVNSYYFINQLSDICERTDTIVTDMGMAFQCTHQAWKVKKGQRLMTNCGLAPMGWGLPAAVGAAFATGRRVICITGEGGLMMNIQELATVMHHKLPIKIFVLNNGGYATIKQTQELGFEGRLMGVNQESGLSFPRLSYVAGAHDIHYQKIPSSKWVELGIRKCLDEDGPSIGEVMMSHDQPQAPRSLNRRNPDGTMNPTKLEDAFPFLDPQEVADNMRIP